MEIGKALKEAREARGITLEAVEEETKIRRKYIRAMEMEQFQVLPCPIYAKAFLKNYARFLTLNVEEILEAYNSKFNKEMVPEDAAMPLKEGAGVKVKVPGKPKHWIYFAAAVLFTGLIITVYLGANAMFFNQPPQNIGQIPNDQGQDPSQQGQDPSNQGQVPEPTGVQMVLNVTTSRCWMLVVVDGTPAFQGELSAGQSRSFEATERILVRLGNAGVVEVEVNGNNMGFLGAPGEVLEREFKAPTG